MEKFGLALQTLIERRKIKKFPLQEKGLLNVSSLNKSISATKGMRMDRLDHYLKAMNLTWMDYAEVLTEIEEKQDLIVVQKRQERKIYIPEKKIPKKKPPEKKTGTHP